ncbi:MAG: alpha/beta hydrolase fold domain-containing protein [Paludibacter sp.]|nr:alpha/beta hydrolase fold domain-containing protein [Paludibacter sp.]
MRIRITTSKILFLFLIYNCFLYGSNPRLNIRDIPYRVYNENDTDTYKKNSCKLDISYPQHGNKLPTILFIHGGGLTSGVKFFPNGGLENLDIIQIAVTYRLSPKVLCPTYIEDVAAAIAWAFNNVGKFGGDPNKIYLSGVSAGAYLANMVYFDKSYLNVYGIDPDSLAGLFSYSSQMTTHYQVCYEEYGNIVSSDTKIVDKYAPLFYVRKTIKPVFLFTGDSILEMPGRYVQNTDMLSKLTRLDGVNVYYIQIEGYDHNSFLPFALKNTIKILNNDTLYLDSIKNKMNYLLKQQSIITIKPEVYYSSGSIKVKSEDTIEYVYIYNILGKSILTEKMDDVSRDINVRHLKHGFYLVKIVTKHYNFMRKIYI